MIARRKCLRKKILDNSGVVCYYHTIANAKTGRSTRGRRIREGTGGASSCAAAEKVAPERQTERERVGSDGNSPVNGKPISARGACIGRSAGEIPNSGGNTVFMIAPNGF